MKYRILAGLALASGLACAAASAQTGIGVSYQPALYWSLPYQIATDQGWWKQVGLDPKFTTFPAGAPQIAAAAAGSWDAGGTGSVPAVLGAARFGILTIGLTNDESDANVVMARGSEAAAIEANPASLKGKQILLSTNSTGEYAARSCLAHWGLQGSDMQVVNLGQAQIISAFSSGNGTLAGVWAPNDYTLESGAGARILCTGKQAGAVIPGALIVRADYARTHPDEVTKYLAVYLRAIAWEKTHPKEQIDAMRRFYQQGGVTLDDKYLEQERDTRPIFGLSEQLALMDRSKGASQVDQWFGKLASYMVSTGTLEKAPAAASYITDEYMKRIMADPKLRAFAEGK